MPHDPNLPDRLLELIFGLLPDDEAGELRAEIEKDATLAEAYADAQATAELIGEAAKVPSPRIALHIPEPNGRSPGSSAELPRPVPVAALTPWSRWAQWGIFAAAGLLVAMSLVGWTQCRTQLAGAGADHLRLQVTGPSNVQAAIDNRYSITTTTVTGRPVSTNVHFAVYSRSGTQLLGHTEKTGSDGTLRVAIPADLQLPDEIRLEIEAGAEESREKAESLVRVQREPFSTHLSLDRMRYAPGETVRYRSVTLSRFHLEPSRKLPVAFQILGPQGTVVEGSSHQASTDRGAASGEFQIPDDGPGGSYTLVATCPDAAFPEARREFRVEQPHAAQLRMDLEFAGVGYGPGMDVSAALRVAARDGTPASGAVVQLAAQVDGQSVYQDSTTTDSDGGAAVRFRLPDRGELEEAVLVATIDDGTLRETLIEPVPLARGKITVDFFPEGGDLAAVGENRVYFTARDSLDQPVDLTGWIVDEQGKYHAAVATDHQGRGMFRFSPQVGIRYRLLPQSPQDIEIDARLPFVLPAQKIVLNTGVGVFGPGRPIEFNVRASQAGLALVAMASCRGVHVGEQTFLTKTLDNGSGRAAANAVAIPLPEEVAGVIRLTIFDYSVSPPRPVAERLVYRRPLQRLEVDVAPDRKAYAPGQSCRLGVSVTDESGQPVKSMLGLSVVDEAALLPSESGPATMTSHFWLTSEIEHPEEWEDANFLLDDSPEAEMALDLLLGTQGWRRFVERSLQQWHDSGEHSEQLGRLVALGAETLPPLMLDNLADMEMSSHSSPESSQERDKRSGDVLIALIVLGGAGLLVLVTMLSLLRIAVGVRLWAPAVVAVSASFFLVFFLVNPGPPAYRAVAFQPYCPPANTETSELTDLQAESRPHDKARDASRSRVSDRSDAEPTTQELAIEQVDADAEGFETRRDMGAKPTPGGPEDEDLLTAEELSRRQEEVAEPPSAPADTPMPTLRDSAGGDIGKQKGNTRQNKKSVPESDALPASPESIEMDAPAAEAGVKKTPDTAATARLAVESAPSAVERRESKESALEKSKRDESPVDRLLLREYHFDSRKGERISRANFAGTVLWEPLLETDGKGRAEANFNVSDSITRFRIVADALGAKRIGSAVQTIVSQLPFHITPQLPEQVTLGDRIDIPLVIANDSGDEAEVQVSIEATEELRLVDPTEVASKLGKETHLRQFFAAEAVAMAERAIVEFRGRAGQDSDAVERALRIEAPGYPQLLAISGVLGGEQELAVEIPEDVVPNSIRARLTVFPSPAADLQAGLQSINGGGFEATVAVMAVSDLLATYLEDHEVADPDGFRLAKQRHADALERLGLFRDSDNGYARYEGAPGDVAATAEVLLAFQGTGEARGRRLTWMERTAQRLLEQRDAQGGFGKGTSATGTAASAVNSEAWALWALAETGQAGLDSELEQIAAIAIENQDTDLTAVTALAASRLNRGELATNLLEGLAKRQADDGSVDGKDVADVEATALAALAWLAQPAFAESASKAVSWLLSARGVSGGFGSDRGTALALHALVEHAENNRRVVRNGKLFVRSGDELIGEQEMLADRRQALVVDDFGAHLKSGPNPLLLGLSDGNRLPYTLALRYHRRQPPAVSESCPMTLRTSLAEPKVSEGQTVALSVRLANTGEQLLAAPVAEIGLPAGLEISPSLLEEGKKAGRFAAYETRPGRLILFWQTLQPGQQIDIALDASAVLPGHFTGPASSSYLQQEQATRCWAEPVTLEVAVPK